MEETKWIGKSGGKTSDPDNWDNGVPNYRKKAVFDVSERTEITWDLKSLGIPMEIRCDPEYIIIYISGDCMVGGSYFVPDSIREHFEAFKDDSLNPDTLDRPPPGYGMFNAQVVYTWENNNSTGIWEENGNWSRAQWPGKNKNDDKALFTGTTVDACITSSALTIGDLEIQSGYTGTVQFGKNLTVDDSGDGDGNVTIAGGTVGGGSSTFTVRGNWSNSGTFTCGTSTVIFNGSSAQTITSGGDAFYNLSISNSGSADINVSGNLDINRTFTTSLSGTLRLDYGVTSPNVNTAWNVTIGNGFSITHGTGTWTFDGTTTYSDINAPNNTRDIGTISIGGGVTGATLTLGSEIKVQDCTIVSGNTFNAGGSYTIKVDGDWSNSGTFTCSTSTVEFIDDAEQNVNPGGGAFNILTINNTSADAHVDFTSNATVNDDLTITDGIMDTENNTVTVNDGITISSNGTLLAGSSTIYCAGNWTNSNGTFTKGTSSVEFNGSRAQLITTYGAAFYNLKVNNSASSPTEVTFLGNVDVDGSFELTDGQIDMDSNNPAINTAGNVTITSGCYITAGSGTWTFDGVTNYTDNSSPAPQDTGNISISVSGALVASLTLNSGIQVRDLTIDANTTLDAGGTNTIKVDGDWDIDTNGTFTKSTSTVEFNGAAVQLISCLDKAFNNVTISNSAKVDIDVYGTLITETFDCSTSNCRLDLQYGAPYSAVYPSGDVTLGDGFIVVPGNPWIFKGTLTYTDNNSTAQNLGDVILDPGVSSITVTLATHIHFIDITIESNATFSSHNQKIYCDGDWTNSGTFTYGTSHVYFGGTTTITGMYGSTNKFYDVTINSGCGVYTSERITYHSISGSLTKDQSDSGYTMQIWDLDIHGTFHVSVLSGG